MFSGLFGKKTSPEDEKKFQLLNAEIKSLKDENAK
jgi:hypothetical protein